jgi:outer membrane protein TolC
MFNTRVQGLGIALAVLLIVGGDAPRAQADEPKDIKVNELLKERLALLQEVVKQTTADYQSGKVSIDRVHHAQMAVLNSRLELCETDKERITILEEAVALAKNSEETATALYKAGKVPASDRLMAKAARLETEIALERARAKVTARPK